MNEPCDTGFAHAVRLAATGLRSTSKVDPEIEAAPLAMILRGDRVIDADGLELLARLVTGKLRAPYGGKVPQGETMLAHAVRRAGGAWRVGKGAHPATTGAALANMLRAESERIRHGEPPQIGPGERTMLARLVAGELRRGTSRPMIGAGHPQVVAIVQAFRKRMADGMARKNAALDTALEFDTTIRTVEIHLKAVKEREAAIQRAESATDI